jgi:hypothetical protein
LTAVLPEAIRGSPGVISVILAATPGDGIALAAIILSAAGLIYGFRGGRVSTLAQIEEAMSDRIDDLVHQLEEAKAETREMRGELAECAKRCSGLEKARTDLLLRLARMKNGDDH